MGIGTWCKSLQLPYANENNFDPIGSKLLQETTTSKRPARPDTLGGRLWKVWLYLGKGSKKAKKSLKLPEFEIANRNWLKR